MSHIHDTRIQNCPQNVLIIPAYYQLYLSFNLKILIDKGPELKCEVCAKSFYHKASFNSHQLWHTGRKLNVWICLQIIFLTDLISESPHKCVVCAKSFTRNTHLLKHMESHSKIKKDSASAKPMFPCDFCSKIYTRKAYLKAHISIHTKGAFYFDQWNLIIKFILFY